MRDAAAEQRATADLVQLCERHGRAVMLRVMSTLQFRWASQGLTSIGVENPAPKGNEPPQRAAYKSPQTAKPVGNAVGKAMNTLRGKRGNDGQGEG